MCPERLAELRITATLHQISSEQRTLEKPCRVFGKHSVLHTAKILRLSEDLPMVVEIADSLGQIEQFLPMFGPNDDGRMRDARKDPGHSVQSVMGKLRWHNLVSETPCGPRLPFFNFRRT